jgi:hypothetical protein
LTLDPLWSNRHSICDYADSFDGPKRPAREAPVSDDLQPKIRALLDDLYRENSRKPLSFFFEAVYEALPELEELDPERVRQIVSVAFAQNEVDHASRTEEALRSLLARVRHEGNRSPEYVKRVERQHAQAVGHHAQAIERLDQIMKDCGERPR